MAKKTKSVVNVSLLSAIANGAHVANDDATKALLNNDPPLIGVDTADLDSAGNARAWLTDAGKAVLPDGTSARAEAAGSETPQYAIIDDAVFTPRERKRGGGGGAPTVYPWATLEVGKSFFVPVSAKHSDPLKSMTSAVSSANMKYSEATGEKKMVTRAKRGPGNKAEVDANGNKIMETVERNVMKPTRKFEIDGPIKAGDKRGGWTAPSDGVLIFRTL